MVVGNGAEGVASSAPLLGHLVHVGRPSVAFQGLVLLAGAPDEKSIIFSKLAQSSDLIKIKQEIEYAEVITSCEFRNK